MEVWPQAARTEPKVDVVEQLVARRLRTLHGLRLVLRRHHRLPCDDRPATSRVHGRRGAAYPEAAAGPRQRNAVVHVAPV